MTPQPRPARQERLALVDTLRAVGPDAPTLCEGWATRDLAAHLLVREHRADAMPGILVPALSGHTEKVQGEAARQPYEEVLATVASGPGRLHPARVPAIDEAMNTAEMFVHHEDVLRAQPGWVRRELTPALTDSLWRAVSRIGRLAYRSAGVGVVLHAPGHGRVAARRPGAGEGTVVLTGAPGELLLHAFGRDGVAQVDVAGDPTDVATLASSSRSL